MHHTHGGAGMVTSPGARDGRYARVEDEGWLHGVSERDVRRLSGEDSDGDEEGDEYPFSYTARGDGGRGGEGRGEEYDYDDDDDDEGVTTPRGYGGRGRSSRRE